MLHIWYPRPCSLFKTADTRPFACTRSGAGMMSTISASQATRASASPLSSLLSSPQTSRESSTLFENDVFFSGNSESSTPVSSCVVRTELSVPSLQEEGLMLDRSCLEAAASPRSIGRPSWSSRRPSLQASELADVVRVPCLQEEGLMLDRSIADMIE